MFSPSANITYARAKMPKSSVELSGPRNHGRTATRISSAMATATLALLRSNSASREERISRPPCLPPDSAPGAEGHDQDQVTEHDHGRPLLADPVVRDLLDAADDDATEGRALDVADAPHHRRGEGDEPGPEALEVPDVRLIERVDQAARAGQQAAEEEGERDGAVDVDAHEARRLGVLRRGAHRLARARLVHEPGEQEVERDRHSDREQVLAREAEPRDVEDLHLSANQVWHALLRAADPELADVLEDEREPHRRDERRELRRVAQRPVSDALDHHVHCGA